MNPKIHIGLTTCNDKQNALHIIKLLLDEGLIACGQVQGPILSQYVWENEVQERQEWKVVLKFKIGNEKELYTVLKSEHQYETPQWVYWPAGSSDEFSQWVNNPSGY